MNDLTAAMGAPFRLCMARYDREVPWNVRVMPYSCTHPKDHAGEHSWQQLAGRDEQELERLTRPEPIAHTDALLAAIHIGAFDDSLEELLAVAHERKRSRRGRPAFERLR